MSHALAPRAIILTIGLFVITSLAFWVSTYFQGSSEASSYHGPELVPDPEPLIPENLATIPEAEPQVKAAKKLIIVIDDVGYSLDGLAQFLSVPIPLTFAVLPGVPFTTESAELIIQSGHGLMLHQPMEALGDENEGPGLIQVSMGEDLIEKQVQANIDSLPGLGGANNHMGSKGTRESAVLRPMMEILRQRNLFFLDSRTSSDTIARSIAEEVGVLSVERDVFLDNDRDEASIRKALLDGLAVADNKGYAIMIGHVWSDELARVLIEEYQPLLDQGYSFDTLANFVLGLKVDQAKK